VSFIAQCERMAGGYIPSAQICYNIPMVNRVIRFLVGYHFAWYFAFGLISPIFAVFILKTIPGSTLQVVGLSATAYWVARTLSTVPLSKFMDKTDGERDEFYFLLFGSIIISSVPLLYLLVHSARQLYLVEFIHGLANSMAVPAWRILFIDHLDKGKTGYEWSFEDIAVGLAIALSAYLGAVLAEHYGFNILFIGISILNFTGVFFLLPLYRDSETLAEIKRIGKWPFIKARRAVSGLTPVAKKDPLHK